MTKLNSSQIRGQINDGEVVIKKNAEEFEGKQLSDVAISGDYDDLENKPAGSSAQVAYDTTGDDDAYTATIPNAVYVDNMLFLLRFHTTNKANATLNVNGMSGNATTPWAPGTDASYINLTLST